MTDTPDQSDLRSFDVTREDDTNEYYVHIDGEKHGPIDPDDLQQVGNDLYRHFVIYPSTPPYDPDTHDVPDDVETTDPDELLEEDIDDEIDDIPEVEELEDN